MEKKEPFYTDDLTFKDLKNIQVTEDNFLKNELLSYLSIQERSPLALKKLVK